MPTLKQSAKVAEQPEMLSQFKISVERAAAAVIKDQAASEAMMAWAKRALGDVGKPGQSSWYASRILLGAVFENPAFIDAALEQGPLTSLPDDIVNGAVDIWVARYAAKEI